MKRLGPIGRAVQDAIRSTTIPEGGNGVVALAKRYAFLLDEVRGEEYEVAVYSDLGPKLLATLTALGMTVGASGAKGGGPSGAVVVSKLDELRQRRERRAGLNAS